MISIHDAAEACERILGGIRTITVTTGVLGASVLLADEVVITISPVHGEVLVATQRWLKARPKRSDTLSHVNSTKDENWHKFRTTSFRELCRALHLAVPTLEHRAGLAERIAMKLGGVPMRQLHETDPKYWLALAKWIDGSGLMSRNDAKFARIYARNLRRGAAISPQFRSWAMNSAAKATEQGFTALEAEAISKPLTDDAGPDPEESGDLPLAIENPDAGTNAAQPLIDYLSRLDLDGLVKLPPSTTSYDVGPAVRAAVARAGAREDQRAAKKAVAACLQELRGRLGPSAVLDRLAPLAADTAAALAVRNVLDDATIASALSPWERVTGSALQ